jgi:hypothetical protein
LWEEAEVLAKPPEKQERENLVSALRQKYFARAGGLGGLDMAQGMIRKQDPWIVRAFQSVSGNLERARVVE